MCQANVAQQPGVHLEQVLTVGEPTEKPPQAAFPCRLSIPDWRQRHLVSRRQERVMMVQRGHDTIRYDVRLVVPWLYKLKIRLRP